MIDFSPGNYFIGLWYLEYPRNFGVHGLGGNMLSAVWREPGAPVWQMRLRHRYYCGEEISTATLMNSGDTFNWTAGEVPGRVGEAEMISRQIRLFAIAGLRLGIAPEYFPILGDVEKFTELVESGRGPRWMNMIRVERTGPAESCFL